MIIMILDDYCFLTIIVNSKNWTILIIVKENITVNRQNRLIAHPYTESDIDMTPPVNSRSRQARTTEQTMVCAVNIVFI